MKLRNSPVSWKSKKQSVLSKSSAEAEYVSMSAAASKTHIAYETIERIRSYRFETCHTAL